MQTLLTRKREELTNHRPLSSDPCNSHFAESYCYGAVGLPRIGGGLPLAVLMFRKGETGRLEQPADYVGRVASRSMVPCEVHGGAMVLPGSHEGARCHSQY